MDSEDRRKREEAEELISRILYLPRGVGRLEKLGIEASYGKNHVLIEAGNVPDFCYIVRSGRIISCEYTPSGNIRVYHVYEEGTIIGEGDVLFDYPSQLNFMTGIETEVICISKQKLMSAVMEYPEICLDLMQSMTTKYSSLLDHLRNGKMYSVAWRVSDLLLIYAQRYGVPYDGRVMIKEKISQQMMSDILGVNRISIVNAISELKNKMLVEQINGFYCVRDMEKLAKYRDNLLN